MIPKSTLATAGVMALPGDDLPSAASELANPKSAAGGDFLSLVSQAIHSQPHPAESEGQKPQNILPAAAPKLPVAPVTFVTLSPAHAATADEKTSPQETDLPAQTTLLTAQSNTPPTRPISEGAFAMKARYFNNARLNVEPKPRVPASVPDNVAVKISTDASASEPMETKSAPSTNGRPQLGDGIDVSLAAALAACLTQTNPTATQQPVTPIKLPGSGTPLEEMDAQPAKPGFPLEITPPTTLSSKQANIRSSSDQTPAVSPAPVNVANLAVPTVPAENSATKLALPGFQPIQLPAEKIENLSRSPIPTPHSAPTLTPHPPPVQTPTVANSPPPDISPSGKPADAALIESSPPQSQTVVAQMSGVSVKGNPAISKPNGTGVALNKPRMKFAEEKNEIAGRTVQKLPRATQTADVPTVAAAKAAPDTSADAFNSKKASLEPIFALDASAKHIVNTETAGVSANTRPADQSAVQVERLSRLVQQETLVIRQSGASSMAVSLKLDSHTELFVQLKNTDGHVQASIRCDRGNLDGLAGHWSDLQNSLSHQNVQLLPLENRSTANGAALNSSSGNDVSSSFKQSSQNPGQQASNLREDAPVAERSTTTSPSTKPKSKKASPKGWESWA